MIRVLDKKIADKIAAGEVVERPLSIIKELAENSLDAGADDIVIEIKNGGKTYIRITDNGCGIEADQCETAFLRHATSKIEKEEDLDAIYTLGFRGEALASIAAVSKVELLTKTQESSAGKRVELHGGDVVSSSAWGCPDGTTFIVKDLFYNTPARQKFLKKDSTEAGLIVEFVTNLALAYPHVRVRMISNDRILFATNGKGDRLRTIMTLTSRTHTETLIPFIYETDGIKVEGYVSGPGESRKNRKGQVFFVNGRAVGSRIIEKGIERAYRDRLFEGRFPVCYLFLTVNPETMDVNIHPNKKEVRFYREDLIENAVADGIISALTTKAAVPEIKDVLVSDNDKTPVTAEKVAEALHSRTESLKERNPAAINRIFMEYDLEKKQDEESAAGVMEKAVTEKYRSADIADGSSETAEFSGAAEKKAVQSEKQETFLTSRGNYVFDFTALKIHGQIFRTYIQLSDDESVYFLDQHAAHERVFFEKLMKQFRNMEKHRQTLLIPFQIDVSHREKEMEDKWLEPLYDMGFTIEEFGPVTYKISEIPSFFEIRQAEDFLEEFIQTSGETSDFQSKDIWDRIATKACKKAVKGNDSLSQQEIENLLDELGRCENPYSCPHGRPVFIRITKKELEKRFRRV